MTGIVVARYNEDTKWLEEFNDFNIHLYNKGEDELVNSIKLPNVGREAHTYLTHIVNNYDNLDDVIIFTQGNPDHASDINEFRSLENFSGYKTFVEYYGNMTDGEIISRKNQPGAYWMAFSQRSQITPNVVYKFLYGKEISNCWVAVCAIFAVDKETILKHSKEKYQQLLMLFDRPDFNWMAYVLEYSWTLMFKPEGFNTEEVKENII
jgi:hypothetical protein